MIITDPSPTVVIATFVTSIVAVVFGSLRRWQVRLDEHTSKRKRRAEVLVALGGLAFIFSLLIFGNALRHLAYVDSAVGSTRAIIGAEQKYSEADPSIGYTCNFADLQFLGSSNGVVINRESNGYELEISGCQAETGKTQITKYHVTARPLVEGLSAFCSDESGVIRYDSGGSIQRCIQSGTPLT